jgi:ATP-dependent Clp protease protease subunit
VETNETTSNLKKFRLSLNLHYHGQQIENSLTPYILEERSMNVTIMDVFSRLMMERIIWVAGGVDDRMSTVVQAQLMFLDSLDHNDITMHIDSPGGSVKSGLSMVNVMDLINSDIRTICTGMAASMGSVLLGAGKKGKRGALVDSEIMLHQSSGGAVGNIQDAEISMKWWKKKNKSQIDIKSEDEKIADALVGKSYEEDEVDDEGGKTKDIKYEFFKDGKFKSNATYETVDSETFETTDIIIEIQGQWKVKDKFIYYTYDFDKLKMKKILHFHPIEKYAMIFVGPLMDAEKKYGFNTKIIIISLQ